MKRGNYKRIWLAVILMSFWKSPVYGKPLMTPPGSLSENGTRQSGASGNMEAGSNTAPYCYTEAEVDTLIEELSQAALESIEEAAAKAAKAAALASIEREAKALADRNAALALAAQWEGACKDVKTRGVKNAVITGLVCFFGGLAIGAGTIAIVGGR
jgi:hypothetical protein